MTATLPLGSGGGRTLAASRAVQPDADEALVVERVFAAPREAVFRAWTDPARLLRWCAPPGYCLPHDVAEYRLRGVYREVVAPERLVFAHRWDDRHPHETLVTVTLAALAERTRLTLHQEGLCSAAAREAHRLGWQQTLERLAAELARGEAAAAPIAPEAACLREPLPR